MTLRTRLLLAFLAVVLLPLAVLAMGLRQYITDVLRSDYNQDLGRVEAIAVGDLRATQSDLSNRLASLEAALADDASFRLGSVAGRPEARSYVLDYAGTAMRQAGLSMLQIQDEEDRIISSGHFRNEHGRQEPGLVATLMRLQDEIVLIVARRPDREFLALARAHPVRIAGRTFTLIGGLEVNASLLQRLATENVELVLRYPGGALSSREEDGEAAPVRTSGDTEAAAVPRSSAAGPAAATEVRTVDLDIRVVTPRANEEPEVAAATLEIVQRRGLLADILRGADRWFLGTAALTALVALLLAAWISARISRPIAELADKTAVLDLDRLDVQFEGGTDEVGRLASLFGDLADRLRSSTARIREAERRATIGDLARQINHDVKNGLIPLRNVMRHLAQVERENPSALPGVFAERRPTIESSVAYLETLAGNYERLATAPARGACDLNALIPDVVRGAQAHGHVDVQIDLAPDLPRIAGSPVVLRRILDNLISNAVDSLEGRHGRVTVATQRVANDGGPAIVRLIVADTGRGMSEEESGRIFTDFYTTKPGGTGLGLSIVRRLVMDLRGSIRVESEPGKGTRMIVEIPAQS